MKPTDNAQSILECQYKKHLTCSNKSICLIARIFCKIARLRGARENQSKLEESVWACIT
jgi:hypothetical protein